MSQLHTRSATSYLPFFCSHISRVYSPAEQESLHLGKTRICEAKKRYQANPESFTIDSQRSSSGRLPSEAKTVIERELFRERNIIRNLDRPITICSRSTLRDRLMKQGITCSVNTIIDPPKKLSCPKPRKTHKAHDREVLTSSDFAFIQQDNTTHPRIPYPTE